MLTFNLRNLADLKDLGEVKGRQLCETSLKTNDFEALRERCH